MSLTEFTFLTLFLVGFAIKCGFYFCDFLFYLIIGLFTKKKR